MLSSQEDRRNELGVERSYCCTAARRKMFNGWKEIHRKTVQYVSLPHLGRGSLARQGLSRRFETSPRITALGSAHSHLDQSQGSF